MNQTLTLVQAVLSCLIVPGCYAYFSICIGRRWDNHTTLLLFHLILLMILPNVCMDLSYAGSGGGTYDVIYPRCVNFFRDGVNRFHFPIESIVIISQSVLVLRRLAILNAQMKRYELRYTTGIKLFFVWSVLCAVFAIVYHSLPSNFLTENDAPWIYFSVYAILGSIVFTGIALKMNVHPIVTRGEHPESVQMDSFIRCNKELACKVKSLFENGDICCRQGLVIDDVAEMLGTNRTYFTRMMRAEFGMSFTEYVQKVRVDRCREFLSDESLSLEDVASKTGFGSVSNMTRVFHKLTGETPDAWRKSHSKQ